jgi:hypothetical protein
MKKSKDLRLVILKKIQIESEAGTDEFLANIFLSTIHSDLGTIRRALIELVENDFLKISNTEKAPDFNFWKKWLDTKSVKNPPYPEYNVDIKNPKRFVEKVGKHQQIPSMRLVSTIEGIKFLIEYDTLKRNLWFAKYRIHVAIILLIIGGFIGWLSKSLEAYSSNESKESQSQLQPSSQTSIEPAQEDRNTIVLDLLKNK